MLLLERACTTSSSQSQGRQTWCAGFFTFWPGSWRTSREPLLGSYSRSRRRKPLWVWGLPMIDLWLTLKLSLATFSVCNVITALFPLKQSHISLGRVFVVRLIFAWNILGRQTRTQTDLAYILRTVIPIILDVDWDTVDLPRTLGCRQDNCWKVVGVRPSRVPCSCLSWTTVYWLIDWWFIHSFIHSDVVRHFITMCRPSLSL